MIVFKDNEVKAEYKEQPKLDGVYLAIICYSGYKDENNRICYVYMPEVYGAYDGFPTNYPCVEVPFKQDNDDLGHEPQIGELVKVSFDDGSVNDGRFLFYVPVSNETIIANKDYIESSVLPTEIIEDITDPQILAVIDQWLDNAYYVTTGKHKTSVVAEDFEYRNLATNDFDNFYLTPLTMPLTSNKRKGGENVPIFTSNIYKYFDVIQNICYRERDYFIWMFNNVPTLGNLPPHTYKPEDYDDWTDDEKFIFVSCMMSFIDAGCANIVFPNLSSKDYDHIKVESSLATKVGPKNWWNPRFSARFVANYVKKEIIEYENEWKRTCASWLTGINNVVPDKEDMKFKQIIILCLTIVPWFAQPFLRYYLKDVTSEAWYNYMQNKYRSYNSIFATDEQYSEFGVLLRNAVAKGPKEFVSVFKEQTKTIFGNIERVPNKDETFDYDDNVWKACNMENKFKYLDEVVTNILNS